MASERWIKAEFYLHEENDGPGSLRDPWKHDTPMRWESLCKQYPYKAEEFLNGLQKQFETICKNDSVKPRRT